jgi:hypothetical protein
MAGKKVYGKAFKITSKQVKAYGYAQPNPVPVTAIVAVNGKGAYKKAQSAKKAMSGASKEERLERARKLTKGVRRGHMDKSIESNSSDNARKGKTSMKNKTTARSRVRAALNKNPKKPTPAQLKARAAFAKMVKAKAGKMKRNAGGVTARSAKAARQEMKNEWARTINTRDGSRTQVMGAVRLPPIPTPPAQRAGYARGGTKVMPAIRVGSSKRKPVDAKVVKSRKSKKGSKSMAKKRSTKRSGKRAAKSVKSVKAVKRTTRKRKAKKGTRKSPRRVKRAAKKVAKKGKRRTRKAGRKTARRVKRAAKKSGRKAKKGGRKLTKRQRSARRAARTRKANKAARSEAAKKASRKRTRKAGKKRASSKKRSARKTSPKLQKRRKAARVRRGKADRRKTYASPRKSRKGRKGRRMKRNGKSFFKRNGMMELVKFAGLVTAGVLAHKAINAALNNFVIDKLLAPEVAAPIAPAVSGLPAAATPIIKLLASAAVAVAGTYAVKAVSKDTAVVNAVAGGMVASVLHQAVLTAVNMVSPTAAGYLSGNDGTAARLSAMYGYGGGIMPAYAPISGMGEYFEGANGVGEYFGGANGVGEYFEGTNGLGAYGANPDLYQAAAGYGMMGDNSDGYSNNISPTDDLDRQLTIAEAAAGVGSASYEASAGYGALYQASAGYGNVETLPGADTWVPGSADPQLWAGVRPVDEPQSATSMVPAGVLESGGGAGIFG